MFVPLTKGGQLRKRLTNLEEGLRQPSKVKFVEEMGQAIGDLVVRKDPWGAGGCGRPTCFPCQSTPGKCMRQGAVVYTLECATCKTKETRTAYIGETARTPYDQGLNHSEAIRRGDGDHPMVAHFREDHPGEETSCSMKVLYFEEKNLSRQAREGQLIAEFSGDKILNGRGDWGQNLPPRLEVEGKRPPPSPYRRGALRPASQPREGAGDHPHPPTSTPAGSGGRKAPSPVWDRSLKIYANVYSHF